MRSRRSEHGHVSVLVIAIGAVLVIAAAAVAFVVGKRGSETTASIFTTDFANRMYSRCGDAPVKLTDGAWTGQPTDAAGVPDHVDFAGVRYGDVTDDGQADIVVSIACASGASGFDQWVHVFTYARRTLQEIGAFEGNDAAPSVGIGVKGRTITTSIDVFADGDAHCCPSSHDVITYTWTGSKFVESDRTNVLNPKK